MRKVVHPISLYLCLISVSTAVHPSSLRAENPSPGNSILRVELDTAAKVKVGSPLRAHTVEPYYESNQLVIPAGTVVFGKVAEVSPATKGRRASAISHGDFTPLHEAGIQFDVLRLRDGSRIPISTALAEQGSQVVRFQRSGGRHASLLKQGWAALMNRKNETVSTVTAPGKTDRLKKYVYGQLPWHPEMIESGSQYDVALLSPIASIQRENSAIVNPKAQNDDLSESRIVHARLQEEITSKSNKQGDAVTAIITQPIFTANGQIEIPQGAVLRGRILRARAARKWGKNGALRFTFNQVDFPQGAEQQVSGVPSAVDGAKNRDLKLDSEGGVEPDTNKGIMVPLALGLLAASAITDEDGGLSHTATASNGFGLITRVVVMSTGSKYFAGTVGMIDTARTVYTRFLAHGRDVVFPKNSQVEVEVGPTHKLTSQQN